MVLNALAQYFSLSSNFQVLNMKFLDRITVIVILFIYKALPQKEKIIIVFSNKHSESNKSRRQRFPLS